MSLHLVPMDFDTACRFVAMWHRHHQPPVGHKYGVSRPTISRIVKANAVTPPAARDLVGAVVEALL